MVSVLESPNAVLSMMPQQFTPLISQSQGQNSKWSQSSFQAALSRFKQMSPEKPASPPLWTELLPKLVVSMEWS